MRWTGVQVLSVGVFLLLAGGVLHYGVGLDCESCRTAPYANDLTIDNERGAAVTAHVTVAANGTTAATATARVGPNETRELTDLVDHGRYRVTVAVGADRLRTRWPVVGCHHLTVEVSEERLDSLLVTC